MTTESQDLTMDNVYWTFPMEKKVNVTIILADITFPQQNKGKAKLSQSYRLYAACTKTNLQSHIFQTMHWLTLLLDKMLL